MMVLARKQVHDYTAMPAGGAKSRPRPGGAEARSSRVGAGSHGATNNIGQMTATSHK
jgi:hypothetical protein